MGKFVRQVPPNLK